jgi:hypothetical protein
VKEKHLRSKIINALRAYGGFWVVTTANVHGTGGLPDITGCFRGDFFAFEVKLPGKEHTLTARQSHCLKRIRAAGGKAAMVTSVSQAMAFVYSTEG